MLMSSVSVSNCIKFYQTAEDIGAEGLRKYCEEIITSHWVHINYYCSYSTEFSFLTADDFACIHIIAYFELFSNF
jgi:hypothetical protein